MIIPNLRLALNGSATLSQQLTHIILSIANPMAIGISRYGLKRFSFWQLALTMCVPFLCAMYGCFWRQTVLRPYQKDTVIVLITLLCLLTKFPKVVVSSVNLITLVLPPICRNMAS